MSHEIIDNSSTSWFEWFLQYKSSLLDHVPIKKTNKKIVLTKEDWEFVNAKSLHNETQKEVTNSFPIE